MSNNNEEKVEVPQEEKAFAELLKKYQVGLKGNLAETITENIARTGGERVFEYPDRLAERLASWHEHISPVRRKQILEHWFAEKGIEVPAEALETAGLKSAELKERGEAERKRHEEEELKKAKFFVDIDTGQIRAAKEGEKALTWDEAERVADRMKKEKGAGDKDEKEPPFIPDGEGNWQLNPKAKIGGMELLAFEAVRKSQERGQPLDPFEVMKERANDIEIMRSVFGGGKGGGGFIESADDLLKLKALLGLDEEMKTLLSGLYKKIGEVGEGKGESEEVKGLRDELKELSKKLEEKDREKLGDQITTLQNSLTSLRGELAKVKEGATATSEYGIMSEGLKVIDRRLGALEGVARGVFGKQPKALLPGQKEELTEAIGEEAVAEQELENLAEEVFYQQP